MLVRQTFCLVFCVLALLSLSSQALAEPPGPCGWFARGENQTISSTGPISFHADYFTAWNCADFDPDNFSVALILRDANHQEIAGTASFFPELQRGIWVPESPLSPGTYTARIEALLEEDPGNGIEGGIEVSEFSVIVDENTPPPAPPEVEFIELQATKTTDPVRACCNNGRECWITSCDRFRSEAHLQWRLNPSEGLNFTELNVYVRHGNEEPEYTFSVVARQGSHGGSVYLSEDTPWPLCMQLRANFLGEPLEEPLSDWICLEESELQTDDQNCTPEPASSCEEPSSNNQDAPEENNGSNNAPTANNTGHENDPSTGNSSGKQSSHGCQTAPHQNTPLCPSLVLLLSSALLFRKRRAA